MPKYKTTSVTGHWVGEYHQHDVLVSTDSWDGVEDLEDERIFFYTDGEPLFPGAILPIDDGFVIDSIEGAI